MFASIIISIPLGCRAACGHSDTAAYRRRRQRTGVAGAWSPAGRWPVKYRWPLVVAARAVHRRAECVPPAEMADLAAQVLRAKRGEDTGHAAMPVTVVRYCLCL